MAPPNSNLLSTLSTSLTHFGKTTLTPVAIKTGKYRKTTLLPALATTAAFAHTNYLSPAFSNTTTALTTFTTTTLLPTVISTAKHAPPKLKALHRKTKKHLPSLLRKFKKARNAGKKKLKPLLRTLPSGMRRWVVRNPKISALIAVQVAAGCVLPGFVGGPLVWAVRVGTGGRAGTIMTAIHVLLGDVGASGLATLLKAGAWEMWIGKQLLRGLLAVLAKVASAAAEAWVLV
ncbi:hypothetical protein G7Y89_g5863 [Cudoniella acicularis]|uniref:Uncharacterized protein n=1 Tax=Cudoniella acicularis TaxID=354080 RepID=A0A8H4RP11_9HELO|nr:hypothetical protein G7Y89_g5863 [Cudoniella acicularis]